MDDIGHPTNATTPKLSFGCEYELALPPKLKGGTNVAKILQEKTGIRVAFAGYSHAV